MSDTYEPGSTSKIFTVSAGIENGAISGNESYTCNGSLDVGGWTIHCAKRTGHGTLNVTQGLMQSCNVVMMHIAAATGRENFCKYQRLFGFGAKTGIDLPGEAETSTLIHTPENMGSTDLATNSFGQNYNCSMIQLASAFSSVINGGSYYQPHVVKQILNEQGAVVRDIQPELVRETVSAGTSEFIRNALYKTVAEGTGKAAQVDGYKIGGKTGTAEKYPRGLGNYLVSFCGFAPADNPQVLCYVIVDTPHTADQPHSTYASEIFQKIMTDILPYMGIYSDKETATVSNADAAVKLPANEGISDSTNGQAAAETAAPVVYDTDEVIETAGTGDAENLPGIPAGGGAEESAAAGAPSTAAQKKLNEDEHPEKAAAKSATSAARTATKSAKSATKATAESTSKKTGSTAAKETTKAKTPTKTPARTAPAKPKTGGETVPTAPAH